MSLNVLITGYEAVPFYKKGGLGDVLGSLPKALHQLAIDIRLVMPYYTVTKKHFKAEKIGEFVSVYETGDQAVHIYQTVYPGTKIPVYFLENRAHLNLINNRIKKIEQFGFFALVVVEFMEWLKYHNEWQPDIVHCNDWHTSLIPLILSSKGNPTKTVLTIHNLLYQGRGSMRLLDLLHIKPQQTKEIKPGKIATEINLLGEGIMHTTSVTTVSPSYASEITATDGKNTICRFLDRRKEDSVGKDMKVHGILNGVDYSIWNPQSDPFIVKQYGETSWETGKSENKQYLLKRLSLPERPIICFIGRLSAQKGLDILLKTMHRLTQNDISLVILGVGNPSIQRSVEEAAKRFPNNVRAQMYYNEDFAHKLYAGSDFIVIPSHYEPCGLIQMVAMKYGTLPIASETGGLKDSIRNGENGFLFLRDSPIALAEKVSQVMNVYKNKAHFRKIVLDAMRADFSWDKSAKEYKKLYEELITPNS